MAGSIYSDSLLILAGRSNPSRGSRAIREVLDTTRAVLDRSQSVWIDFYSLDRFSRDLLDIEIPSWDNTLHFTDETEATAAYLMVLDSLNFCFWAAPGRPKWEIIYGDRQLSGYDALAAALKRAVEESTPILEPDFLETLTLSGLKQILDGSGELQLLEDRLRNLHELARNLQAFFSGSPARLIEAAEGSAARLASLIARYFPSFRDGADYRGKRVFFYKRAQILAADLHEAFGGKHLGRFNDMDQLTAFADYKLPQVLRHLGIMRYAEHLADRIDRGVYLPAGSPEEVEIRALTVWAVEWIRQAAEKRGRKLKSYQIDRLLWNLGQDPAFKVKPYHRTLTVFY